MWFVVGLGNPGAEYDKTRHNAGFVMTDAWAAHYDLKTWQTNKKLQAEVAKTPEWLFLKPQTFMNASGQSVRAALDYFAQFERLSMSAQKQVLEKLVVIHDDLDIAFGQTKFQFGKGPKVHNGLLSIYEHLGSTEFWHARIGIDGRGTERRMPAKNYVLQPWTVEEQMTWKTLPETCIKTWQTRLGVNSTP
jgi:PTH1 family peptidyl-tRNA hydrolase